MRRLWHRYGPRRPGELARSPELYREAQTFHRFWYGMLTLLAMAVALACAWVAVTDEAMAEFAWVAAIVVGWAIITVMIGFGHILVTVTADEVLARVGPVGWPCWRFPLAEVEACRVTTFSLLREYGGYGIGPSRSARVCIVADGSRGVELKLRGRVRRYVIGARDPERLLLAIRLAAASHRRTPTGHEGEPPDA